MPQKLVFQFPDLTNPGKGGTNYVPVILAVGLALFYAWWRKKNTVTAERPYFHLYEESRRRNKLTETMRQFEIYMAKVMEARNVTT